MEKGGAFVYKVSGRQVMLMGVILALISCLISVSGLTIHTAQTDFWLSYILAILLPLLVVWLMHLLIRQHSGKDVFEILANRWPFAGKWIILLILLYYWVILCRDVRRLVGLTDIILLPDTPLTVINILIVFTAVLLAMSGLEVLARVTEVFLPILLVTLLLVPAGVIREVDWSSLQPILANGLVPSLKGAWLMMPYFGEIVALVFVVSGGVYEFRQGFYGLLMGVGFKLFMTAFIVLSLGVELAGSMVYPVFEMIRQVQLTDFLDRFDLPLIGLFYPCYLVKLGLNLYLVAHGIKVITPDVYEKDIVPPLGVLAVICSFWFFHNMGDLYELNRTLPFIALVFQFLLPIVLFFLLRTRNRQPGT